MASVVIAQDTDGTRLRKDVWNDKIVVKGLASANYVAGDTISAATHGLNRVDEVWVRVPLTAATKGTATATIDASAGSSAAVLLSTAMVIGS